MTDERLQYPLPFPIHLPTPDRGLLWRRGAQMSAALTVSLGRRIPAGSDPLATAKAVKDAMVRLGGTYLKLGQIAASSPGMFGDEVAGVFRATLDEGPAVPVEQIRELIENELGRPMSELFREFDEVPIGRASLAVVHRAVTVDGELVAVKVLRPRIEHLVAADFALLGPTMSFLADQIGMEIASAIDTVVDGLREQLEEELDLRNERRTMDHHRALLERVDLPLIVIPRSYPDLSSRRVLTMEFLDGYPIDDLDAVQTLGIDPKPLAEELVKVWFTGLVRDGTFHGDVHAGNVMLLRDGRLGLIDWGIVGRLDEDTHTFFRSAIRAMLGETEVWDEVVDQLTGIYGEVLTEAMQTPEDELKQMLRSVFEPFFTQPFNAHTLATLVQQMPQAGTMGRQNGQKRSPRQLFTAWRENRRIRALGAEQGVRELPFNRGIMLLVKQLLYFDRYGHLFLDDTSLLEDKAFYASLLAEAPLVAHR